MSLPDVGKLPELGLLGLYLGLNAISKMLPNLPILNSRIPASIVNAYQE